MYYAFVDFDKAFDRVYREVVTWVLRKLRVDECLIRTVMTLYTDACTVVRTDTRLSQGCFDQESESTDVYCCHECCLQ